MVTVNDNQHGGIQVDGLNDLQKRLRTADAMLPRQLKRLFDEVANELIVPEANRLVQRYLSTKPANVRRRKGTLEGSVRGRSQQREGRVVFGIGRSNNYAPWWEFGGSTKAPKGGQRQFYAAGRTLYPALRAKRADVQAALEARITELAAVLNG